MKKRLVVVMSAVLVLSFLLAGPAAAIAPSYWTGNPDPMKCNQYHDCHWVVPVCIGGNTFNIGLYFDPAAVPAGTIETQAKFWSGTVLTAGACPWIGYSVPHVILYKGSELTNGYGIIVSTKWYASVDMVLAAFKLTAPLPADVKPICEGPVIQMSPDDIQGTWACDPSLIGILPNGHTGGRLPLINDSGPSLQKIYEQLLNWLK